MTDKIDKDLTERAEKIKKIICDCPQEGMECVKLRQVLRFAQEVRDEGLVQAGGHICNNGEWKKMESVFCSANASQGVIIHKSVYEAERALSDRLAEVVEWFHHGGEDLNGCSVCGVLESYRKAREK